MKKNTFTLSEVLISLGIISLVAALTIPTLMAKINEKQTVNKVKKVYSMLSEAYRLAIPNEGDASGWSNNSTAITSTTATEFFSHLRPYLKISQDCGTSNNCGMPTEPIKYLSGSLHGGNYALSGWFYKFMLLDGTLLWMRTNRNCSQDAREQNVCALIWVDINGNKPPYQLGKDVFVFYVKPTGIIPHNNNDCNLKSTGYACSKYIIDNGNMNYLHE